MDKGNKTFLLSKYHGPKEMAPDIPAEPANINSLSLHLSQMEKMAAIGQLSSSVAHEMRNLLGMIRTAAFNIDRAVNQGDRTVTNNLEIITRSVGRAREFIDNLLNLSCVPHGKEEVMDVCKVADNLLTLFSKEFEWHNIRLERQYTSLPLYRIDCHALQECLLNLILNAIQSMDGDGTVTIEIQSLEHGFSISVEDTGCGIPPEDIHRIFDQFYTTKKNDQGTGLGLTIARNLAQDMGGTITVESQVGRGSRFILCLPALLPVSGNEKEEMSSSKERKVG